MLGPTTGTAPGTTGVSDASPQVSKPAIVASAVQQGPARDASTSAAMQLADEACRSICHANLEQPFYSISDAVQQLLPYHMLSCPDPDEADEEEAAAAGRCRISGRRDAAEELQLRRTVQLAQEMLATEAQIEQLEKRVLEPGLHGRGAPEDSYQLEQLLLNSLKTQHPPAKSVNR